ncbi:multidrug efflux SMR transporter [Salinisphaera sp. USBA-960]|nr:multidrug efflux SMR transporter [Salifodinibacter halophilus]NNC26165.1 multidrug efflux SMR transporter [Salifodinibacter halophilus]
MSVNWLAWTILLLAVVFEVIGTSFLNASQGFTRPWFSVAVVVSYIASFVGLALALKTIDMSIAYAVWAGLGIVFITFVGSLVFNEAITVSRMFFIALILTGVVGLNLLRT